jgi:hypothetical protein
LFQGFGDLKKPVNNHPPPIIVWNENREAALGKTPYSQFHLEEENYRKATLPSLVRSRNAFGGTANAAMVLLYWDIGRLILERQENEGWGTKVIDRLSAVLRDAYPGSLPGLKKELSPKHFNI